MPELERCVTGLALAPMQIVPCVRGRYATPIGSASRLITCTSRTRRPSASPRRSPNRATAMPSSSSVTAQTIGPAPILSCSRSGGTTKVGASSRRNSRRPDLAEPDPRVLGSGAPTDDNPRGGRQPARRRERVGGVVGLDHVDRRKHRVGFARTQGRERGLARALEQLDMRRRPGKFEQPTLDHVQAVDDHAAGSIMLAQPTSEVDRTMAVCTQIDTDHPMHRFQILGCLRHCLTEFPEKPATKTRP